MSQSEQPPSMYRSFKEGFQEVQQFNQMAETILKWIRGLIYLLVCSLSFTAEVFLRRRLGERYFTIGRAFFGMMAIFVGFEWAAISGRRDSQFLFEMNRTSDTPPMFYGAFLWIFIAACLAHYAFFKWRVRRGVRWHSRSPGIPHLMALGFSYWRTVQIVEPVAVFVAGFAVLMLTRQHFGSFLMLVSIALLVKSTLEYGDARRKLLDALDSTIESEDMAKALDGTRPLEETHGFVIPGASSWHADERKTLQESFEALDPSLKDLLNTQRLPTAPSGAPQGETFITSAEPRPFDIPPNTNDTPPEPNPDPDKPPPPEEDEGGVTAKT